MHTLILISTLLSSCTTVAAAGYGFRGLKLVMSTKHSSLTETAEAASNH